MNRAQLYLSAVSILLGAAPAQAGQICPDMPPTSGSSEDIKASVKLGLSRILNLVDTNASYSKQITSMMKDDGVEFKLIMMVTLCRAGQQKYPDDPDKQVELIVTNLIKLFPNTSEGVTPPTTPSNQAVPKESLPTAANAHLSPSAASSVSARPFSNNVGVSNSNSEHTNKQLSPREQWRQVYFKPILKGTWHVFVVSEQEGDNEQAAFDRIVAKQKELEKRYPNVAFRPLDTVNDFRKNPTWSLTIGHGLDVTTAKNLTTWARNNVASDAYTLQASEDFDDNGGQSDFRR